MTRAIQTDRRKSAVGKHWTAKDKVRAVASYLVVGNMAIVSEQTGIPLGTLNYWKTQPWWFEQIEKIRQAEDTEIDSTFTRIVKKTQEIMLDRLENGDFYVDKDGGISRKPVSVRDAAIVGAISIDKRKILREESHGGETRVGMQERLKNLEAEFTKLVKKPKPEIIDIVPLGTHEDSTESDITPIEGEEIGEEELQEGIRDRVEGTETGEVGEEQGAPDDDQEGGGESGGWEGRGAQESLV